MAETYTNIRLILDKLLRNPLMADVSFETAVDYTIELIRLIGMPNVFIEKVVGLGVKDYRAALPCDFSEVIQIRTDDSVHRTLRYSTDSFHCVAEESRPYQNEDPTYKIQGGIIYTSFSSGPIELSYRAIKLDDEGYPLIPDNVKFTRALEWYIKYKVYTNLFEVGKIAQAVLQNTQQEYDWAIGAAQSEMSYLSLDKAESFFNSFRTLLIRDNAHRDGFKSNSQKEYIKLH